MTQQESQIQEEASAVPKNPENTTSESKAEESVLTVKGFEKCTTFEEITNRNLPTLSVKIGIKSDAKSGDKNDESSKVTTIAKYSPKIDWSFGKIDLSEIDGFYLQGTGRYLNHR